MCGNLHMARTLVAWAIIRLFSNSTIGVTNTELLKGNLDTLIDMQSFSVRSAYYLELAAKKERQASTFIGDSSGVWRSLWKAQVPIKVKQFG